LCGEHIIWRLTVMRAGLDRAEEGGGFEKSKGRGEFFSVDSIEQVISLLAHPLVSLDYYA
jgi:hypothetical protein